MIVFLLQYRMENIGFTKKTRVILQNKVVVLNDIFYIVSRQYN